MSSNAGSNGDMSADTEAAWVVFRGRLADHVAAMADDDVLVVDYVGLVEEDEEASGPYVQLCAFGDSLVQAEAASNHYLHETCRLGDAGERALRELGFEAPFDEDGWENFHATCERREADRVAVMLVRALREVYGVPHPAFVTADGLERQPGSRIPEADGVDDGPDEEEAIEFPRDRDHLQALLDASMRELFPDLEHDPDGDISILAGTSVAFVRVLEDRPSVEWYAEIVVDPVDRERLRLELELLNAAQPLWKFVHRDDVVIMRHEVVAAPFVGFQIRLVTSRFAEEVDQIATELRARVGGRRFLDPDPAAEGESPDESDEDLAMMGLLELLHLGRPRSSTVSGLFDHDRRAVIAEIVRIRGGLRSCGEHEEKRVLDALRRALRFISDGGESGGHRAARNRSVQGSLLSEAEAEAGEESLDLGWSA